MKLKVAGQIKDYRSSPILGKTLTLSVNDDIADQLDKIGSKPVTIQIKTMGESKGRSKDANAYLWELLTELQNAGYGNCVDLYRKYIREDGVSVALAVPERAFKTYERTFTDEGVGFQIERTEDFTWTDENGRSVKMAGFVQYYGSHVYNSAQMARLIDAVVQDCEAVGIKTKKEDFLNDDRF